MIESFVLAVCSLIVALYVQARLSARQIRRNRQENSRLSGQDFSL